MLILENTELNKKIELNKIKYSDDIDKTTNEINSYQKVIINLELDKLSKNEKKLENVDSSNYKQEKNKLLNKINIKNDNIFKQKAII